MQIRGQDALEKYNSWYYRFFWTRARFHRLWSKETSHTWYCKKSRPYYSLHFTIFYKSRESFGSI